MKTSVTVNDAQAPDPLLRWKELREYHDFLRLLIWRELHLRYRHTAIGIGWSFLHPLLTMLVFVLIVPNLVSRERLMSATGGVPYSIFVYCGMAVWTCFSHALVRCNTSLVDQRDLIKNMYFPRIALPLSKVLAAVVELLIGILVLLLLMALLRVWPSPNIVLLPLMLVPLLLTAFGCGLLLAIVQVRFRDVFFVLQFALQLGMLVTPVWFPVSALPPSTRWIVALNPLSAIVQGFRWAVLGVDAPSLGVVCGSLAVSGLLLIGGLLVFRRRQATVADHV